MPSLASRTAWFQCPELPSAAVLKGLLVYWLPGVGPGSVTLCGAPVSCPPPHLQTPLKDVEPEASGEGFPGDTASCSCRALADQPDAVGGSPLHTETPRLHQGLLKSSC